MLDAVRDFFSRMLALSNESRPKTIFVAVALCLVCSIIVSMAAVFLKPQQLANKALDKKHNILEVAGLMQEGKSMEELFAGIEAKIVDLQTGEYVTDLDVSTYDQRRAARDPSQNVMIESGDDIANIHARARYATVYLVKDGEQTDKVILPVHGYGLWSTMYGFVALEEDANTVYGLRFYEHAETPGLGGEVDNAKWRAQWRGKKLFDESGTIRIDVVQGNVDGSSPDAVYKVDGLSGATLTSRGVENLLRYWMGAGGFRPYLDRLRQQHG
ncbi:MAG: Na(+)-translocating NADH-quinone reductase subunit C [Gammaproteobacteria bacterium]|nr:Na(+)-translocating NADH-quinone reductase subunit C [Gammaproteobacteria bacterium]